MPNASLATVRSLLPVADKKKTFDTVEKTRAPFAQPMNCTSDGIASTRNVTNGVAVLLDR